MTNENKYEELEILSLEDYDKACIIWVAEGLIPTENLHTNVFEKHNPSKLFLTF